MANAQLGPRPYLRLHDRDAVVVALQDLSPGFLVEDTVQVTDSIARGHKVAVRPILKGEYLLKYGEAIGYATRDIATGEHVHTHNLTVDQDQLDFPTDIAVDRPEIPEAPEWAKGRTFEGYLREDGRVGTRNYILIASSVNCSATVAHMIAERARPLLKDYPNVDGVFAITHRTGCGIDAGSKQHQQLARTISGFIGHPCVSRAMIVGLGCEVGQISYMADNGLIPLPSLKANGGDYTQRVQAFHMQDLGGTEASVLQGLELVKKWLPEVNALKRTTLPVSKLVVALNCGGSDGYSGITANPLVGRISDVLTALGATSALAETPETYGAHQLLMRRAATKEVGEALLERINWWKGYTKMHGASMDSNPAPGNKAGGITTIVEKSLGAAAKGGSTQLGAVYQYAERMEHGKGFVFMDTPGHDPVSMSGLIAGGANLGIFTTGRGSCYGSKPAPTIKVATNTPMYERMKPDMDVNAGDLLEGATWDEKTKEMFDLMLAVASGETKPKSEALGLGDHEFAPWDIGATY